MVPVSYTNGSDTYRVEPIEDTSYIDDDADKALILVEYDVDLVEYKEAMHDSVRQGLAYAIYKNDVRVGYVYNRIYNDVYVGCSINAKGYDVMILAMKTMFEICDKHKIVYKPHSIGIEDFKSMIRGVTIRAWHSGKETVSILREDVEEVGRRVFDYVGMKGV